MAPRTLVLSPVYPRDFDGKLQWAFVEPHDLGAAELQRALLLAQYDSRHEYTTATVLVRNILSVYGASLNARQSSSPPALNQNQALATLELLHGSQLVTDAAYSNAVAAIVNAGTYRNLDDTTLGRLPLNYEAEDDGDWSHVNHKSGSVSTLECLTLDEHFGTGVLVPVEK